MTLKIVYYLTNIQNNQQLIIGQLLCKKIINFSVFKLKKLSTSGL